MAEIVLFPSVLGMRPGITVAAERLEASGHVVHSVDLYGDGRAYDDYAEAMSYQESVGYQELLRRAGAAVEGLPSELMYAGFSAGAAPAQLLAATRPGARGAVLLHGAVSLRWFELDAWPASVPVQVHFSERDPYREREEVDALASSVRAAGAAYEFFEYPGDGHLFADPSLPAEYDAASAEQLWTRVLAFLGRTG
jgi:dienelactone hydrolase